jgi:2-polyprenyl-3-methyl-5-hydroxy-6-metoxy-1,4-benzoquinol methylase
MMQEITYAGNELELFQYATVWKKYFGKKIKPYLKEGVLEVGAGMGSTTLSLCDGSQKQWLCLEPDPALFQVLQNRIEQHELPSCCTAMKGTLQDLPSNKKFDTIMYIDVIEHIQQDADEIRRAAGLLHQDGFLIVLVPAHQFVFNEFDRSIGHFRRYNKKMLEAIVPAEMVKKKLFYLDSLGLLASVVNKYFLKQDYPTLKQINFWDKTIVRISKVTDFLINYQTGKSLIGIWQKV